MPTTDALHKEEAKKRRFKHPRDSKIDFSQYCSRFVITVDEMYVNLTEYCTEIAGLPSIHVIQIDECVGVKEVFDWKQVWHEKVLD